MSTSQRELNDTQKREYNSFLLAAKEMQGRQDHRTALHHYQQAYQLHPSHKLEAKISKLMTQLSVESQDTGSRELQEVTDNKRQCPFTPMHSGEKRRSPIAVEEEMDKENVQSMDEQSSGSDMLADDVTALMSRAKQAIKEDNVKLALSCYTKANALQPSDTLQRRIQRMQSYLDNQKRAKEEPVEDGVKAETSEDGVTAEASEDRVKAETSDDSYMLHLEEIGMQDREYMSETGDMSETDKMQATEEISKTEHSGQWSRSAESSSGASVSTVPSNNSPCCSSTPAPPAVSSVPVSAAEGSLSDEQVAIYNSLLSQAKVVVRAGHFEEARSLYSQAYNIHASDKLLSKINKLKAEEQKQVEADKSVDQIDIDAHYTELVTRGRQLVEQEDLQGALAVYQDAYGVKPSDKLERKLQRIKEYMQQQQSRANSQSQEAVSCPEVSLASSTADASGDEKYNRLITSAKMCVKEQDVKGALQAYEQAASIRPSAKLAAKITKCKEFIESNEEVAEFMLVGNGFYLHQDLYSKLYPHQKEGLLWLWGLHKRKRGGILADDMGLGKTIQVIAFLSGLFDAEEAKTVIIAMPLSLIENWRREFDKWAPGIQVQIYHGGSQRERARATAKIQRRGGVLLTSYGMIVSAAELIAKKDGESFGREYKYDYVILDEGHKIKNPTKTSKGVHLIAAQHRIILTGTPIQNNLKEMWALFDWTHHGMLLGTARTFQLEYNKPITRAREKCATYGERRLGEQMADSLKRIIAPFLLRRTKAEVKAEARARGQEGVLTDGPEMPNLTRKNDFVVWCYLSELQKTIYESFTQQDEIKQLLNTSKSPLTALVVLKKICDHPRLMSLNQCHKLGLFTPQELLGAEEAEMKDCAANTIKSVADSILMEESGKLQFLVQLMARLKEEGHRTLIFSLSRKMLDIIQKVLTNRGHKIMRMDGTITDLTEREKCVSSFQKSNTYDTFLLTTQVGGVGLTLTAADRVVIFDPSWNPATDSQAVDRAFRIGQQKNVCIYRFISCGTIEEKIYRRQVFKDSVNRQTMQKDDKNLFRYFSNTELYELFQLDNTRVSKTQQQLDQMHSHQRVTDTALDEHIAYLYSCEMYGLSDHDLMFSKEDEELEGDENVEYIEGRVNKAVELLSRESELQGKMNEEEGKYIPGHLQVLPKTTVKPPQHQDLSSEVPSSERLIPEYDYAATAPSTSTTLLPANDWRTHAGDDSDVVELTASSPAAGVVHRSSDDQGARFEVSNHVSVETSSVLSPEGSHVTALRNVHIDDSPANTSHHMSMGGTEAKTSHHMSMSGAGANKSHHMSMDGTEANTSHHMSMGGAEATSSHYLPHTEEERNDNLMVDESDGEGDKDSEGEVLVEDSDEDTIDDSDNMLDNSIEEIEESQSGSMLGEHFGQLSDYYVPKDSSEVGTPANRKHKRRSTVMARLSTADLSEDEVESDD